MAGKGEETEEVVGLEGPHRSVWLFWGQGSECSEGSRTVRASLPSLPIAAPGSPSCLPFLPYLPAPAMGSHGPSFLCPIPVVITSSGCVGRSPTCFSTLQWVGEKEQRRETLSLSDRNDILT